jgi:hypothetical protein
MYIPKFVLALAIVGIVALIVYWFRLRKRFHVTATSRLLSDMSSCLPRMKAVEVATVIALPNNELFEIVDSIDSVLFPRLPFQISNKNYSDNLELALAAGTSLPPRIAHIIARYSTDELAICRGGLAALYEAKTMKG